MPPSSVRALTTRDIEILEVLTHKVRVLSVEQIARTWWKDSKNSVQNTRDRLRLLSEASLVIISSGPAHPEISLSTPVVQWSPDENDPDLGAVSYQLQRRWNQAPQLTCCVAASAKAATRFGGHGGRQTLECHRTHDIHLAAVYLLFKQQSPDAAGRWIFEERIRRERDDQREKLPDAMLLHEQQKRVIEFGGAYSKQKLEGFHAYCREKELPYEVW